MLRNFGRGIRAGTGSGTLEGGGGGSFFSCIFVFSASFGMFCGVLGSEDVCNMFHMLIVSR